MPMPTRRLVRLTVLTPTGQVDLSVADDAVVADVVRTAIDLESALSGAQIGDDGWCLVHPSRGELPSAARLDAGEGVREGEILVLSPRPRGVAAVPVDDAAEHVRGVTAARESGRGDVVGALVAVLLAPVAVLVAARTGGSLTVGAIVCVLLAIGGVVTARASGRDADALLAAATLVATGAVSAAVSASVGERSTVAAAATLVLAVGSALGAVSAPGRWWRPLALGAGASFLVLAAVTAGTVEALEGPSTAVLAAIVALVVLVVAVPLSLTTSGLGRIDDRVAAGEEVSRDAVSEAVTRAADDLTALCVVTGAVTAWAGLAVAEAGPFAMSTALALATAAGTRGASLVRTRHRAPLIAGSVVGAAAVFSGAVAVHEPRAVPVLVVALVALVRGVSTRMARGVDPVTLGRLRPLGRVVERVAVVAVPVCAAGAFGLYGRVWERFA